MAGFPFHDKVQGVWKATDFLGIIFDFFSVFDLQKYMPQIIIGIFVTVAFQPITETLMSILQCSDNGTGGQTLDSFPEVVCYQGWHLFHAAFTSVVNFLYVILCSIVALTYFSPLMTSSDRTARQSSKGEVVFIINKTFCQVLFSFVNSEWILTLVVFFLSLWMWKVYNIDNPYYDKEAGLFYNIITTYYLWTNLNLLISLLLYDTSFNGGLIAWLVGLPFLIFIMVSSRKSNIENLIKSQVKFKSGEEVQNHIRYVLELIDSKDKNKNSYMLLIGYVEKHKEICELDDCYLKLKVNVKKKMSIQEEMNETCKQLIKELERMYLKSLKKFPRDTNLRLSYAFFLLERMKKQDSSQEQFQISSTTKPGFDQQFTIYRFLAHIEEEKSKRNQGEDGNKSDNIKVIKFRSSLLMLEDSIKLSSALHKSFWNELKEDNPDLQKLNSTGSQIAKQDQNAYKIMFGYTREEIQGKHVNDIIPNFYSVIEFQNNGKMFKYHDFLMQRFNNLWDKDFLTKYVVAPEAEDQCRPKYNELTHEIVENQGFGKLKSGYIFPIQYLVTLKPGDIGFFTKFSSDPNNILKGHIYVLVDLDMNITDVSTSCITYFGDIEKILNEEDGIKDKINPDDYDQREPEKSKGFFSKKGKSVIHTYKISDKKIDMVEFQCFITPIYLPLQFLEEIENPEKWNTDNLEQYYYTIRGYQIKMVKDESNSQSLQEAKAKLEKQLFAEKQQKSEQQKQGSKNEIDKNNTDSQSLQTLSQSQEQKNVQNGGQLIQNNGDYNNFLDNKKFLQNTNSLSDINFDDLDLNKKPGKFRQMIFALYENQNIEDEYDIKELLGQQNQNMNEEITFVDYGKGIRVKRLYKGRIEVLENFEKNEEELKKEEEEFSLEDSIFKNQFGDMLEDPKDRKMFEREDSHTLLMRILTMSHKHLTISFFKLISYSWFLLLTVLSIYQFDFVSDNLDRISINSQVMLLSNNRSILYNKLISRSLDRVIYDSNSDKMKNVVKELEQTSQSIIQANSDLMEDEYYYIIRDFSQELSIKVYDNDSSDYQNQVLAYQEALDQINTLALQMGIYENINDISQLYEQIELSDPYFNTVVFNFFNSISDCLETLNTYLFETIYDELQQFEIQILLSVILQFCTSVFVIWAFIFISLKIKDFKENILFLFLDIPPKYINASYKKADKFLGNFVRLQEVIDKNDQQLYLDEASDDEEERKQEEDEAKSMQNKKNQTHKTLKSEVDDISFQKNNMSNMQKDEINQIGGENINNNNNQSINNLNKSEPSQQFNNSYEEGNTNFINNSQQQDDSNLISQGSQQDGAEDDFFNQSKNRRNIIKKFKKNRFKGQQKIIIQYVIFGLSSIIFAIINMVAIFTIKSDIKFLWPQYYYNGRIVDILGNYLNSQKIFLIDYQYQIYDETSYDYVYNNINKVLNTGTELKDGIMNTIQLYFEIFQENLNGFLQDQSKMNNLLKNAEFQNLDYSLYNYVYPALNDFLETEQQDIMSRVSSIKNYLTIFLIIFFLLFFAFFLFKWFPYINSLNQEINRTIQMLGMIPYKVIIEAPNIRKFIIDLVKKMDKSDFTELKQRRDD
ncbi:hypothetical protein PPERSA_10715 [Pseudocohnilembus persalinus]|uniref:TmcB/TmcC TPR repeats domain-containing protein n=1 Tax=Pseudocohnilembus persalinus TaxID=266149 RepID=A0A0V0QDJ5_PSEPJ|nr:hypothetical protein PPERSA_10715 [Pseudocohnilembus persalinus]|eukprot:KRX00216.1 hypothetical protein PPERSA_10715 [Pseudocohnilembus persalinus]